MFPKFSRDLFHTIFTNKHVSVNNSLGFSHELYTRTGKLHQMVGTESEIKVSDFLSRSIMRVGCVLAIKVTLLKT